MAEFFNYIDNIKITFTGGMAIATICAWAIVILDVIEKICNWRNN